VVHSVEPAGEGDILINILMNKKYFDTALLSRVSNHGALSNFLVRAIYQGKKYNDYIIFHSNNSENLHELMVNLMREYYGGTLGSEEAIKCYIVLIFLELLRVYGDEAAKKNVPKKAVITEILKYLDTNYNEAALSALAQRFNFHPNYLSAFLKKSTGQTFKEIVNEKRMNHAHLMLCNTDMDIESISKECGFTNLSFFYKKFKERYGASPGVYRNSIFSKNKWNK
jgi:AraC-like DNA-binding protein